MFKEFGRDVFVDGIFTGQLQRRAHHVQTKHSHPAGAVTLLEVSAVGQDGAPVENADVIQTKKTALEDILTLGILAIDPPGE